jgi:signal transduction histidine kinase
MRKREGRDLEPFGDFIEISVSDTGTGISPENITKVFQPLFTTKSRGIGLGLAICQSYVEANGGSIHVESQLGMGTTFKVLLPAENSR